ncbi:mucin-2-like [Pungitius pungitius]|uniref:mucin-2-like n=1 Tax=Pungitius pungitius TaxID=134920 RepID=UPI002E0FDD82
MDARVLLFFILLGCSRMYTTSVSTFYSSILKQTELSSAVYTITSPGVTYTNQQGSDTVKSHRTARQGTSSEVLSSDSTYRNQITKPSTRTLVTTHFTPEVSTSVAELSASTGGHIVSSSPTALTLLRSYNVSRRPSTTNVLQPGMKAGTTSGNSDFSTAFSSSISNDLKSETSAVTQGSFTAFSETNNLLGTSKVTVNSKVTTSSEVTSMVPVTSEVNIKSDTISEDPITSEFSISSEVTSNFTVSSTVVSDTESNQDSTYTTNSMHGKNLSPASSTSTPPPTAAQVPSTQNMLLTSIMEIYPPSTWKPPTTISQRSPRTSLPLTTASAVHLKVSETEGIKRTSPSARPVSSRRIIISTQPTNTTTITTSTMSITPVAPTTTTASTPTPPTTMPVTTYTSTTASSTGKHAAMTTTIKITPPTTPSTITASATPVAPTTRTISTPTPPTTIPVTTYTSTTASTTRKHAAMTTTITITPPTTPSTITASATPVAPTTRTISMPTPPTTIPVTREHAATTTIKTTPPTNTTNTTSSTSTTPVTPNTTRTTITAPSPLATTAPQPTILSSTTSTRASRCSMNFTEVHSSSSSVVVTFTTTGVSCSFSLSVDSRTEASECDREGDSETSFTCQVTDLDPGTLYRLTVTSSEDQERIRCSVRTGELNSFIIIVRYDAPASVNNFLLIVTTVEKKGNADLTKYKNNFFTNKKWRAKHRIGPHQHTKTHTT